MKRMFTLFFAAAAGIAAGFALVSLFQSLGACDGRKEMDCCYMGNLKTGKFHRLDCRVLPGADSQICFASREEAIDAVYQPCGLCHP